MTMSSLTREQTKDLTILYVEDDDDTRQQFTSYLKRICENLVTASNGIEGLAAYHRHSPHIIITDIQMPLMDGLTLAQEIRQNDLTTPIIILTAYQETDYLMKSINIGIDKFVMKPVQNAEFMKSLLDCVTQVKSGQNIILHKADADSEISHSQRLEAIGKLTSAISHDFNNKLHVISGYAQFASILPGNSQKTTECINEIIHAAESAQGVVSQLLSLSRKHIAVPKRVNVNEIISESLKSVALLNNTVQVHCVFEDDLWPVKLDPIAVDRIIMNITVNALDAMPDGGTLSIKTENCGTVNQTDEKQNGSYILITIQDTGSGMAEETVSKIFQPFFTTKGAEKGTGLGLATVHDIVTAGGGYINVKSRLGSGTTFMIYLPKVEESE